ncbi:efflux RND transporter periplasmic adaptor subunit [Marinomonas transparens]|uniref:Efflux RND transporter periplasmic adaptor subunit n=1 Tax=Marinomonas transparens TaxID=2795388 RepID=A0A934JUR6_9GAMM|nr:efflux RND transporter periplasmic adaptor subunit [Marinomonas transparens]MBJ7537417.1 efflux RND transporter periplasmic adaptor subunit [Marinomonas transparens]
MKTSSQWMLLILSLLAAIAAYFYINNALQEQEFDRGRPRPEQKEQAIDVSTIKRQASSHTATIQASGIAKPRYQLSLTSQVSGEVVNISNQLEAGQRVKEGDVLATLSNRQLNSAVASAKKALASAELALKEEQRQGDQARAEWKAAGFKGDPESDLVLRVPQLANAKADVNAAKAALAQAQDDLHHTKIVAPFDALVINRNISPGSYLSAGGEIATLYSTDRAEITINLASSDWQKLPAMSSLLSHDWPVAIRSIDSNDSWQGKILSVDQHIDTNTRMRSLIVSLASPLDQTPPLLPGAFVTIQLQGKPMANLWQLPSSALSQKSEIWYLNDDNRLDAFETTPLFVDSQFIYIQVPEKLQNRAYHVLVKPYSSYLKDTLVNPVEQAQ